MVVSSCCLINPSDYSRWFATKLGFQTISNLVVGVFIVILFFITISLTVIVSAQKKKDNFINPRSKYIERGCKWK